MCIKTILLITTLLPLLMGIVVSGLMFFENRNDAAIKHTREGMQQVSKAIFELILIDNERYLGETRQRATSQWRQRYKSLGLLLNHLEEYTNTEVLELLIRLRQAHESVGFLFSKINEIYGKESAPFGQESRDLFIMLSGQQRSKLHEMLAHADRILESVTQHNEVQKKLIYLFIYAVIGAITLSGLLLALIINARIVQSIVKLGQGAEIIGSGVLSHRIDLPVGDEFGQLAADFNQMGQRLQESRHQLEEHLSELVAANRELETFSYAVAHNFRTPIRTLSGFGALLLEEYGDKLDENGRHYLQEIGEGCREMDRIINAFLKLTRATLVVVKWQAVDLSRLATTILAGHRALEPGRLVTWQVTPGLVTQGDASLLNTVLENLLDNAWKFTGHSPTAHISFGAEMQEGGSVYMVRDNGVGFDMAYGDKLFQPFQRLHQMTEFPGVSLGLAIVQRIIARHGGQIWAEGRVGQGATFYFTVGRGRQEDEQNNPAGGR